MSTSVELQKLQTVWEPPPTRPLEEAVWHAWLTKGRAQDRRSGAARVMAVKWVTIAGLLAAAALWSHLTPYDVVVRFAVAASAILIMFQALQSRRYAFGGVFAALALLYNPVAPVFSFSGNWQRTLVLASAIPFVVSLAWRNVKLAHND